MQQTECTARWNWPPCHVLAALSAMTVLLFASGCAQLDQLMGKQADSEASAPSTQTVEPASTAPAPENRPAQTVEPVSKPVAKKKKVDESSSPSIAADQQPAVQAPAASVAKQPEPAAKQPEQDKTLAEKEQAPKEKKSRVATDKKSKKSPKPQAEAQPPTEDAFLPPIPLPSKPAAIGGSGG